MDAVEGSEAEAGNGGAGPQLSLRQQCFVDEYLLDLNGGRAYERAGFKASGASARVSASKLLTNPNVRAAIKHRLAARRAEHEATVKRTIDELARVALSDIGSVVEWGTEADSFWGDGPKQFLRLRPTDCLLPCERASIKEVREGKYGLEIELHDKVAALTALAKHFGLLNGEGRESEKDENGVPKIPLATLRELQRRDQELQEKLSKMGRPREPGGNSGTD